MNSYQTYAPAALAGANWPNIVCSNPNDARLDMEDLNEYRVARVAEVLSDFREIQVRIASVNIDAPCQADYFTPAWTLLRQCKSDGQFILECFADISVPVGRSEQEQQKLELLNVLLDAYARRHEAQKIFMRQLAAQRCIASRNRILDSTGGPSPSNEMHLRVCDAQLHQELQQITDEFVYLDLLSGDQGLGRWTVEDPGLYDILNWLRTRS